MLELLSPAGNPDKLRAAVRFGADAVYFAGPAFGMRAVNAGMSREEIVDAVKYAHSCGVRCYITVNTMPRSDEYPALLDYLDFLKTVSPDALIVADIGVIDAIKKRLPGMAIHLSTQANAVSAAACRAWYALGVRRIVLARELSLCEIKAIRADTPADLELEAFVHGSMCISYSGRCLLSSYFTGRDANRGQCTQPCRWNYKLTALDGIICEEKRSQMPLPVHEEGGETFIMSSTDLCMVNHIPELAEAGITSLKVEGRIKSVYYTAVVTNTYRMALNAYTAGQTTPDLCWMQELESVSHREYDTGYFFDRQTDPARLVHEAGYRREKAYLADVLSYNEETGDMLCIQRNKMTAGMTCEIITPGMPGIPLTAEGMLDENRLSITSTPHPMMRFYLRAPFPVQPGDILREASTAI